MPDRERITIRPASAPQMPDDAATELSSRDMYHLLNAAIAPRPVAWVSTLSADGVPNLAPHSYTTVFGTDPPVVGFVSVGRKDSLNNAEATREFVLNIGSISLIEQLNLSAADFPPGEDEFDWAGLTHIPCDSVRPPRVGEAPVSFETRVHDIIPVANCWLILGEVLRVHVAADIWRDGRLDPVLLDPVLRLAGSGFAHLGETFKIERPTYKGILAQRATDQDGGNA